jgi:hypothetical protein
MCSPHKQTCRLTQKLRKRAVSGQKLASLYLSDYYSKSITYSNFLKFSGLKINTKPEKSAQTHRWADTEAHPTIPQCCSRLQAAGFPLKGMNFFSGPM